MSQHVLENGVIKTIEKDILTPEEQELVANFNEDTKLKEAIRKVILQGIYDNGVIKPGEDHDPRINWALSLGWSKETEEKSVEEIGKTFIAISEGIRFLEVAFDKLDKYKKRSNVTKKENKAR
jgi:hypothetical protein